MTEADEIAADIGFFYHDTSVGDNIKEKIENTTTRISNLGIVSIDYKDNEVIITLSRPGLLIGQYGSNINALTKYLQEKSKNKVDKIKIVEQKLPTFLYCFRADYDYARDMEDYVD